MTHEAYMMLGSVNLCTSSWYSSSATSSRLYAVGKRVGPLSRASHLLLGNLDSHSEVTILTLKLSLPRVTYLENIPCLAHYWGTGHIENTLRMVDPPDSEAAAPPVVTTNIPRHFLTGEHSSLVVAGPNTAWSPVGLGGPVSVRHPLEAPPLHDSLEAALLSSPEHVNPLTHRKVGGSQGCSRLYRGILCHGESRQMSFRHTTRVSEETTVVFSVFLRIRAVRSHHNHPVNIFSFPPAGSSEAGPQFLLSEICFVVLCSGYELDYVVVRDVQHRSHYHLPVSQPERLHANLHTEDSTASGPGLPATPGPGSELVFQWTWELNRNQTLVAVLASHLNTGQRWLLW